MSILKIKKAIDTGDILQAILCISSLDCLEKNYPELFHRDLLEYATDKECTSIVDLLLQLGVDPNISEALDTACTAGNVELAKTLLQAGASPNLVDRTGATPLHSACEFDNTECASQLIKHGVDVHVKDMYDRTALHFACEGESLECVKLLLDAGASLNVQDTLDMYTPLHIACDSGNTGIVQVLLDLGADISLRDDCGWTALDLATHKNYTSIIEMLVTHKTCSV